MWRFHPAFRNPLRCPFIALIGWACGFLLLGFLTANSQSVSVRCPSLVPAAELLGQIGSKYQELPVLRGLVGDAEHPVLLMLYANAKTRTFTIFMLPTPETACVLQSGADLDGADWPNTWSPEF